MRNEEQLVTDYYADFDPILYVTPRTQEKGRGMREFETGATRDTDKGKLDFEGFLSPCALKRYAEYMNSHRVQKDGKLRDSDNWQKGIPDEAYMKSMWRHFFDVWSHHRGWVPKDENGREISKGEALCAVIFNAMGMLHEHMDDRFELPRKDVSDAYFRGFGREQDGGES